MPAPHPVRTLLLLLALLLVPATRAGAWSNSANLNTPIIVDAPDQIASSILADGSGGVFVGWTTYFGGNSYEVYVQHFDATGAPLWTPGGVQVCTDAAPQFGSSLVSDGAGGVIVVFIDYRTGIDFDIYAQRVNAAGVRQWTATGFPVVVAGDNQIVSDVISDGAGGVIVSWDQEGIGYRDLYAQRISASGAQLWNPSGVPVCLATGSQYYPNLCSDGAGGVFVAWSDERPGVGQNDIYVQRLNASGVPQWTADGLAMCAATNDQYGAQIVSDQSGGAYVAWYDYRNPSPRAYLQHFNGSGAALWVADGIPAAPGGTQELNAVLIEDGTGGVIVSWDDYRGPDSPDLYAQRFNAGGVAQWTPNGNAICIFASAQNIGHWTSDGQGGAIYVWVDQRNGPTNIDIYGQRLSASGNRLWDLDGKALSTAASSPAGIDVASDGNHGAIVTFLDPRNGLADVYGQRVEQFGQLGNPEPDIVHAKDVANDQGGQVRVSWNASYLDTGVPYTGIDEYRLWRRVPVAAAQAAMERGRTFKLTGTGATQSYWEYVAAQPANGYPSYSMVAPTGGDSMAGSNPRTSFMVEARLTYYGQHFESQPDSGYSVDNLGPPAPSPFTGNYSSGTSYLTWGASPAQDLASYRLYRGTTSGFVPSPANRIASPTETSYGDPAGSPFWYKLSAVDVHGNESPFATLLPAGTVDVPGAALPRELRLESPAPNPTRGAVAFRLALPVAARVSAEFFDQQGRRVGALAERAMEAGERELRWDGYFAGAPLVTGLYFYRVRIDGRAWSGRFAVVR